MPPLPGSRDYDAVDTGPLPHGTVNALQDGIVDHEARVVVVETDAARISNLEKKGFTIGPEDGIFLGSTSYDFAAGYAIAAGGTDGIRVNLRPAAAILGTGNEVEEIVEITVAVHQQTATPITIVIEQLLDWGAINKTVTKVANVTTGLKLITLNSALANLPLELLGQYRYRMYVDFGAGGDRFYEARVRIGLI